MSITLGDIERFMIINRACLDANIWVRDRARAEPAPTARELWRDLLRPDWRWWVLSKLDVSSCRIRAYLKGITWRLARRVGVDGFTGFPIFELLVLLDSPDVQAESDARVRLTELSYTYAGKTIGVSSFHFGLIEACENLARSVLKQDDSAGYLRHAAVALNYALSSASSSGVVTYPEDVREGFHWDEVQDIVTSSDFFNSTCG